MTHKKVVKANLNQCFRISKTPERPIATGHNKIVEWHNLYCPVGFSAKHTGPADECHPSGDPRDENPRPLWLQPRRMLRDHLAIGTPLVPSSGGD